MKKKLWDEKKYRKILNEVGEGQYRIVNPHDSFISLFSTGLAMRSDHKFTCACIATCATTATVSVDYSCEGFVIPRRSQVMIWRTFRYCKHCGNPHYNADDYIVVPDKSGNIWGISRTDSPDHYTPIATWAGLTHIADAYHLPKDSSGPSAQYVENGATVPIKFIRVERESE